MTLSTFLVFDYGINKYYCKKKQFQKHKKPINFATPKIFYATAFGVMTHSLRDPGLQDELTAKKIHKQKRNKQKNS